MVKGISRQVIVVNSPDPKLFEQAIFILKDGKQVSDDALLKEAKRLIHSPQSNKRAAQCIDGPLWACGGVLVTCVIWLLTSLL